VVRKRGGSKKETGQKASARTAPDGKYKGKGGRSNANATDALSHQKKEGENKMDVNAIDGKKHNAGPWKADFNRREKKNPQDKDDI